LLPASSRSDAGTDATDCGCQAAAAAGCPYTNDGECDEGTYCAAGTDTADCSGGGGTCRYANDNECDEPDLCAVGTDGADCGGSGGGGGGGGGGGSNAWGGGGGEDPVLSADGNPQRVEGPFGISDGKRLRLTVPTAGLAYAFKLEPEPTYHVFTSATKISVTPHVGGSDYPCGEGLTIMGEPRGRDSEGGVHFGSAKSYGNW
jgi:hypothetical protein